MIATLRSTFPLLLLSSLTAGLTTARQEYEYIVVGSGPGGGPLAANLARAGHSVLLLEAGDDQGNNPNVTNIFNSIAVVNDPLTRWDFFVKYFENEQDEVQYRHMTYRQTDGSFYVGLNPPPGAQRLGIYYPRAGTVGGKAIRPIPGPQKSKANSSTKDVQRIMLRPCRCRQTMTGTELLR
jgi:choline dehydrogenase